MFAILILLLLLFIFMIFCVYPNKSLNVNNKGNNNLKKDKPRVKPYIEYFDDTPKNNQNAAIIRNAANIEQLKEDVDGLRQVIQEAADLEIRVDINEKTISELEKNVDKIEREGIESVMDNFENMQLEVDQNYGQLQALQGTIITLQFVMTKTNDLEKRVRQNEIKIANITNRITALQQQTMQALSENFENTEILRNTNLITSMQDQIPTLRSIIQKTADLDKRVRKNTAALRKLGEGMQDNGFEAAGGKPDPDKLLPIATGL